MRESLNHLLNRFDATPMRSDYSVALFETIFVGRAKIYKSNCFYNIRSSTLTSCLLIQF